VDAPGEFVDPACPLEWGHPLNAGLIGDWSVTPNSGWRAAKTFRDLTRGGRSPKDGTLTSGPTWAGGKGRRGGFGSLGVAGGADHVDMGTVPVVNALTKFTIGVWVRLAATGSRMDIVGVWASGLTQKFLLTYHIPTASKFGFYVSAGANALGTSGTTSPVAGPWYFVVGTYDGANSALYVNGVREGTSSPGVTLFTGASPFRVAKSDGSATLSGGFDGLLLYDRALSPAYVAALYGETGRGNPERFRWCGRRVWLGVTAAASPQTATPGVALVTASAVAPPGVPGGATADAGIASVAVAGVNPAAVSGTAAAAPGVAAVTVTSLGPGAAPGGVPAAPGVGLVSVAGIDPLGTPGTPTPAAGVAAAGVVVVGPGPVPGSGVATAGVGVITVLVVGPAAGTPVQPGPGGTFRRPPALLARAFARPDSSRRFFRPAGASGRTWRYADVANQLPAQTIPAAVSDDRDYLFDCTGVPELVAGATIGSGEILGGTGLTLGTPTVLTSPADGIAAGAGLSCRISGGVAGTTYPLACKVIFSTGRDLVIPGRLAKAADVPT
jgi:hypothetical protein